MQTCNKVQKADTSENTHSDLIFVQKNCEANYQETFDQLE